MPFLFIIINVKIGRINKAIDDNRIICNVKCRIGFYGTLNIAYGEKLPTRY